VEVEMERFNIPPFFQFYTYTCVRITVFDSVYYFSSLLRCCTLLCSNAMDIVSLLLLLFFTFCVVCLMDWRWFDLVGREVV
jgi:hypothetical protein